MTTVEAPITTVIVDDHTLFRSGIRHLLEEEGIEVIGEAANAEIGVDLIERLAPDVVIMDLGLPGRSGIEASRRIAEASPTTQVLVLTISDAVADILDAIMAGASGYLVKDASVSEILNGVRAAAAGESMISPRIASKLLERVRNRDLLTGELKDAGLTEREVEVLRLVGEGKENSEIAEALFISPRTVKNHVSNILEKLHVNNRIQAAVRAVREGLA